MSAPYRPASPPGQVSTAGGWHGEERLSVLGYMLVRTPTTAEQENGLRQELVTCAAAQGFRLVEIFVERDDNPGLHAYAGLIDALRAGEIRYVIAPAPDHFGYLPGVRRAMVRWIERETGATVLVLHPEADGQPADGGNQ
jgi:hypothetical protein